MSKIKKENKIHRINSRLTDEQYSWYINQSKVRKVKISRFLRQIPSIIKELNNKLDEKDDTIIEMENESIKLRAKIYNLEKESTSRKNNIGTLDDVKEYLVK